ncbi:MAG: lactate utilization protein [Deltaproteobacteria bacterium]|nr:lactate utilization protein [Deltaproteobacteria bacterium]
MDAVRERYQEKVARHIIAELGKKRMAGSFAPTIVQAKEEVLKMIPEGSTVYRCGSTSLAEIGFWEAVRPLPGVTVIDPYLPELSPEEGLEQRRRGLSADIMISSTNAITLTGVLVNLDGMGNRVAALSFGPKKVILVAGMNKVVPDLEAAFKRVKHHAAPLNNIRYGLPNPCVETGLCSDCRTPTRICNMWSVIEGHVVKDRIHVKLVGEPMGY